MTTIEEIKERQRHYNDGLDKAIEIIEKFIDRDEVFGFIREVVTEIRREKIEVDDDGY